MSEGKDKTALALALAGDVCKSRACQYRHKLREQRKRKGMNQHDKTDIFLFWSWCRLHNNRWVCFLLSLVVKIILFFTQKLQQLDKSDYYCIKFIAIKVASTNVFLIEENHKERKDCHEDFERFSCGGITEVWVAQTDSSGISGPKSRHLLNTVDGLLRNV